MTQKIHNLKLGNTERKIESQVRDEIEKFLSRLLNLQMSRLGHRFSFRT